MPNFAVFEQQFVCYHGPYLCLFVFSNRGRNVTVVRLVSPNNLASLCLNYVHGRDCDFVYLDWCLNCTLLRVHIDFFFYEFSFAYGALHGGIGAFPEQFVCSVFTVCIL